MRLGVIAVSLVIAMIGSASADIVPYESGSFESPDISPDTEKVSGVGGWQLIDNAGPTYSTVLFRDGEATDGEQYAEVRIDADDPGGGDVAWIQKNWSGHILEEDVQYRFFFDVRAGDVAPTGGNMNFKVETPIAEGRESLTNISFATGSTSDQWETKTTSWFTPGADSIGDRLRVQIVFGNLDGAGAGVQMDNIRFEFEPLFVLGDFDGNGAVNGLDIPDFKAALADPEGWAAANPDMEHPDDIGDFDDNGSFNGLDIPGFKEALAGGGPEAVPEPATLSLVGLAALGVLRRRR